MVSVAYSLITLLFRPTGSARRKDFVIAAGGVLTVPTLLGQWLDPHGTLALLVGIAFLWTMAVLVCKRLHDIGTSRAWALGLLAAIIVGGSGGHALSPFMAFCAWLPALAFIITLVIVPDGDVRTRHSRPQTSAA